MQQQKDPSAFQIIVMFSFMLIMGAFVFKHNQSVSKDAQASEHDSTIVCLDDDPGCAWDLLEQQGLHDDAHALALTHARASLASFAFGGDPCLNKRRSRDVPPPLSDESLLTALWWLDKTHLTHNEKNMLITAYAEDLESIGHLQAAAALYETTLDQAQATHLYATADNEPFKTPKRLPRWVCSR